MKKGSMLKAAIFCLVIFINPFYSCSSNRNSNSKDKSMDTTFCWEPLIASPRFYPMETKYARVGIGNSGNWVSVMEKFTGMGLGNADGTIDMSSVTEDGKLEVPSSIDVLWLSYTEKKFYRVKAQLPLYLQSKMLKLFREGYHQSLLKEHLTYDSFVINMLPKGHVWLYLTGTGRSELVCDSLQGEEVQMSLKDFDEEGYEYRKTLDAFCKGRLTDYPDVIDNLKKNGIPENLWEKYKRRFPYEITYSFENNNSILGHNYLYRFLTGEYFHRDDNVKHPTLPCVREIQCIWKVGTTEYDGFFFFDENEIIEKYAEAFGFTEKKGELVIHISKYNNKFDIFLRVDGKKYPLQKTMIHVFRDTPQKLKEDDEPFYNNHRDTYSGDIHYIGE